MGPLHASREEGSQIPPPPQSANSASSKPCAPPEFPGLEATLPFLPSPCLLIRGVTRADHQEVAYDVAFGGGMAAFASRLVGGEDALVELGIGAAEQESVLTRELSARGRTFATVRAIPRVLPEPQSWMIEFVDDTELVNHARDVRLRGQILERLVETVPLAIAAKDPADGFRFTLINRYYEETFGIRRADLIGASDRDFFAPELCDQYRAADEAALRDESVTVLEEEIETAIGRRQARTIKIPLFDDQGRPELLLEIIQDVTDLRAAVRQAEQARHVKSRILQGLGGEMKQRISGLLRHLDAASSQVSAPADAADRSDGGLDTNWLRKEAGSLLSRIDEALDVSNLQVRGRGEGSQMVAPLELVKSAVAAMSKESESRAITWSILSTLEEDGAADARIDVNPERLSQALGHLISNAVQFSPRGASAVIRLGLDAHRNKLCISVEDEGIGIPEDEQQALFGAFFDGGAPVPEGEDGQNGCVVGEAKGLGLALCRQLVSSMGGTIQVSSELGEGSVFKVTLPWVQRGAGGALRSPTPKAPEAANASVLASKNKSSSRPQPATPDSEGCVAPGRILLVEDNLLSQRIAVRHLEALGHKVTVVGDASGAELALRSHRRYDFAVVDQGLGDSEHTDIIRRLRALEADGPDPSRLPVLALFPGDPAIDAAALEAAQRVSMEAGANACLSKPLRPEHLCKVFARLDRR